MVQIDQRWTKTLVRDWTCNKCFHTITTCEFECVIHEPHNDGCDGDMRAGSPYYRLEPKE